MAEESQVTPMQPVELEDESEELIETEVNAPQSKLSSTQLNPSSNTSPSNETDEELTLPKATVQKIITEMLPPKVICPKETRELLTLCCIEFIHLLSSEANEACEKAGRKTITPEHVIEALKTLGFESYVEEVVATQDEFIEQSKEKQSRVSNKLEKCGLTEEELIKQQEELFENARKRMLEQQQSSRLDSSSNICEE